MNKFKNLANSSKVALITAALTLLAFGITSFLFAVGMMDVPLGILIGGSLCTLLSLLSGLAEKLDEQHQSTVFSIIVIAVRLSSFIILILISALMYYRWNMPYINVFSLVGIYTASTIVIAVIYILERRNI